MYACGRLRVGADLGQVAMLQMRVVVQLGRGVCLVWVWAGVEGSVLQFVPACGGQPGAGGNAAGTFVGGREAGRQAEVMASILDVQRQK